MSGARASRSEFPREENQRRPDQAGAAQQPEAIEKAKKCGLLMDHFAPIVLLPKIKEQQSLESLQLFRNQGGGNGVGGEHQYRFVQTVLPREAVSRSVWLLTPLITTLSHSPPFAYLSRTGFNGPDAALHAKSTIGANDPSAKPHFLAFSIASGCWAAPA